ncbi:SH2 domain-containing protein 3C-like isoform X2 [Uloborus diversus]|nr:SH2 domain-containing protein 3C-like isoform X2 [Uloborus diversus]
MEPLTGTEASPEELKKALEWELSLDNNDLRSHAWYHGTIPRPRAEELMSDEGDFLIRDCISRPGDYVLTCRWRSTSLHFVINKVVFQPFTVYERIQYQFEDDCFDTVPDLVTYYVGNKRPISAASGAVISKPVNRSMPLSYYATRYGLECQMHYAALALEKVAGSQESLSGKLSRGGSGENLNQERRLSTPVESSDSHPSGVATMPRSSVDYPRKSLPNFSTLQHPGGCKKDVFTTLAQDKKSPKQRSSQENIQDVSGKEDDTPPPKPSRVPSKKYGTTSYSSGHESSNNKMGNQTTPPPHLYSELNFINKPVNGNVHKLEGCDAKSNHEWTNMENIKFVRSSEENLNNGLNKESMKEHLKVDINPPSSFDLADFNTVLLPTENKPLDPPALAKIRCMLLEGGGRIIASHLTKVDLDVLKLSRAADLGLGVLTGFEMLVLPQGQQLRLDLLERNDCLKFFVAITILTCGDEEVRAQVLNKWIQIAIETKTALGNLYGFTGIMMGLALPQISRLRCTWLKLRQSFTENAFTYETKLRPTLKNMQECSNPQAPNTCVPYLMSLILIMQKHNEIVSEQDCFPQIEEKPHISSFDTLSSSNKEKSKILSLGLQWEQTAADYGLQLLLTHLEIGRSITQQWPMYKRNSEIVLENIKYDDLMLDVFRTEFHLRFLWGSKGCHVVAKERYSKFDQVLNVMSERCEPV